MNFRSRSGNLTPIWVLIAINFLVYIVTFIRPDAIDMLGVQSLTFASQPWTIVSAMFTHAGFTHFLFNMITLYFYGMYVLMLVGEVRFWLVYFIGGLAGNALYLLLGDPNIAAVGASGAIFALGGVLAMLVPRMKIMIFPIPFPMDLWIAIVILALLSLSPGIAWQAHLGGIIVGLAAGYIFKRGARPRPY